MPCFGLFPQLDRAQYVAGIAEPGAAPLAVGRAFIDGRPAYSVVDGSDRDVVYEYDHAAPPGWRLTRRERCERD